MPSDVPPATPPEPPGFEPLERESYRIVGMICAETVPSAEIDAAIATLRATTRAAFPERPALFDETFGRRFARLRTRFHPSAPLLETPAPTT
jgi:hypothetical protein